MIVTGFEEQVTALGNGLPPGCDPDSITWVNGYRRLPPDRARRKLPGVSEELDSVYEEWRRLSNRFGSLFERRGWFASGFVGHSVTGSDHADRDGFSYHIIVYKPVIEAFWSGSEPVFELYDEERSVAAYVREVPTPEQATRLLERHGIPAEKAENLRAALPEIPDGVVKEL